MYSFFSGIVAIAEALPVIKNIIDKFYDFYCDYNISKIDNAVMTHRQKRIVLIRSIKGAVNDNERKALSIILSDINKLSDRS